MVFGGQINSKNPDAQTGPLLRNPPPTKNKKNHPIFSAKNALLHDSVRKKGPKRATPPGP
jgi:hypothetical protein